MSSKKKRVLVVDDSLYLRMQLKSILEKNGFEVVGLASNGIEAVEKFKELCPDVITMDIIMPGRDGIKATEMINEIDPKTKIVIVSSLATREQVFKAIKLGACNFIVKPFEEDNVIRVIKTSIKK